jgi:phthalate 4,5-dioxygenase
MPALLVEELPSPGGDPVRVRLLGEDLVAFRDLTGRVGLIQEACPHRGASLYFGRNEGPVPAPTNGSGPTNGSAPTNGSGPGACGLRCPYHGWQFDVDGNCIDMPSEPPTSTFKERVKARAYPVHESGGLVWTYMGPPDTLTPFRDFGTDSLAPEKVAAAKTHSTCNWVQSMEGNLDTSHISWLHAFNGIEDIPDDGSDKPGYLTLDMSWKIWLHDRAPRLEVHDTWYGYRYAGVRTTPNGHTHVRITGFCLPNLTTVAAIPFRGRISMFVPIDDENCWRYNLVAQDIGNLRGYGNANLLGVSNWPYAPTTRQGVREREWTAENDYQIDRDVQRTSTFSGIPDFVSQDLMATETMGPIYDRTQEHLGTTDKAVIRMRRQLIAAAKALAADGTPPPAVAAEDGHAFTEFRSAEKILEPGEDWRVLGTDDDPLVQEEALVQRTAGA